MSNIEFFILTLTILIAFSGIYLIVKTFTRKRKIDYITLKARIFLNESFITDIWTLLLIACLLFVIHALVELNDIFMLISIEPIIGVIIREGTELGVLLCTLSLVYKIFKLVKLAKFEP